ncbi:MAG: aminotransferase class V-fold PLP-dependent enzyme [Muribaculaceae bacterium]|nr:aminotransferase class V-fold PLP-dependent enzyme [Muribaculaceae bacterium]
MIYFDSDYMVGAHPEVLERLVETNGLHTVGYGRDEFTAEAKRVVLDACGIADGEVYFLEGGTQTNAVVIDRLLDHNDGVVAVDTAHINVHEAGAIESTGHKIITLPNRDGKLDAKALDSYIDGFYRDETNHYMVRPGMVYISYPTELGTVYSRQELADIGDVCRRWNIPLYVDGARLAYGLCADGAEVGLKDLAGMCDVFYIGGTKCGALFGEAVVTRHRDLLPRFVSLIKLHGATLAKGRLLGVQFTALFSNGLYERIGAHAVRLAMKLKAGFTEKGYRLYIDSPTNQQFFVLPNEKIDELKKVASFELWGPRGETETPVLFVTYWSTTDADVNTLTAAL